MSDRAIAQGMIQFGMAFLFVGLVLAIIALIGMGLWAMWKKIK